MRKKTHEEYVKELKIKNPTVEIVEKYVDAKTKVMHHCIIHDVYWEVLPGNALAGKGCKQCMKEKNSNKFLKSHDKYVEQVKNVSPHIDVLETYVNSQTPIMHKCKKHNLKWMAYPGNILRGYGCQKCGLEKFHIKMSKSHDLYIEELAIKNPNVRVLENYKGNNIPILHKCLKHNISWKISPANALSGHGCPKCHAEKISESLSKSQEEYIDEVSYVNSGIEVIGKYVNSTTPILHRCKIHNVEWMALPLNILKGHGCYLCGNEKSKEKMALSQEEYIERVRKVNPDILVLGQYINARTPILHKCVAHNYEWITTPESILQGSGCPHCGKEKIGEKLRRSHEEYVKQLKKVNPSIIVLGSYVDSHTSILHKCLKDGCEWYAEPSNILFGYGCPQCNVSKGEKFVRQWLEEHNIKYEAQKRFEDCIDIKPLPFDFFVPTYNLCIEYQGKQHYEPIECFGGETYFKIQKRHDGIKRTYCQENNIILLEIPYFENAEKILNNFLFS